MQRSSHDIFVSYSSKDKPTADAVCAVLEGKHLRCWMAPRDILPGMDWGESIIDALDSAKVMVLVFSAHANASAQIKREVERAVNKGVAVIPLRIEEVAPSRSLEYFISTPHWLDAFTPPLERHLNYLADVIARLVNQPAVEAEAEIVEAKQAMPAPEAPVERTAPTTVPAPTGFNIARLVFAIMLLAQIASAVATLAIPFQSEGPWIWLLACVLPFGLGMLFPASFPALTPLLTPRALTWIVGLGVVDGLIVFGGLAVAMSSTGDSQQIYAGFAVTIPFIVVVFVLGIVARHIGRQMARKWGSGDARREKRLRGFAAAFGILLLMAPIGAVAYVAYDSHYRTAPARAEVAAGSEAYDRKDWDAAIDHYTKAMDVYHDTSAYTFADRGLAYYSGKKYDQAVQDFNAAIEREPKEFAYYLYRGNAYYMKKQNAAAIADYDQVLKQDPKNSSALYFRGLSKQAIGDAKGGAADIAAAKKLDPKVDR